MSIRAPDLLGVLSHAIDVSSDCVHLHSWRVAVISKHIADILLPESSSDVLMAGLLHDLGNVGASRHITECISSEEQADDPYIRDHSNRGAALVESIPGLTTAAGFIRHHHERCDGSGYPNGLEGECLSTGTRILGMVDSLVLSGIFTRPQALWSMTTDVRHQINSLWSTDLREALEQSAQDADFYRSVLTSQNLRESISRELQTLHVPDEINCDSGLERLFVLAAVLVDMKDPSTKGHSFRVACIAEEIATSMGFDSDQAHVVYRAGLLHDIGRLGIPTSLLVKPDDLNETEMRLVRKHAELTRATIGCLPGRPELSEMAYIASHDHERYDGKGYPDGLSGNSIPLASRIITVADAYDAITSASNYRLLSPLGATLRIQQRSGTQFDPAVVEVLTSIVSRCDDVSTKWAA